MKISELKEIINNLPGLNKDVKEEYLKKLNAEGISNDRVRDILEGLRDAIQAQMDQKFKEAGIEENLNSQEYQTMLKDAESKIATIGDDFNKEMNIIEEEAVKLQTDTSKKIGEAQI